MDFWGFLSGIGLFLFGMHVMEQAFRGSGARTFKRVLRERTHTPLGGVITGTVATAVLQSSSLVGLIVLAFVGAGLLDLRSALGVILGANLGTTLKGWLVAFLGFTVDFGDYAEPMIAMGAIGVVFAPGGRRLHLCASFALGLGFLLLGLEQMNGAFEKLQQSVDVSQLQGHHAVVYLAAGMVFTAVIQSSSTTIMILLTALNAQVIDLPAAAAAAIGADLGTTSTVLLGALKGTPEKKRVAAAHFLFNLVTDLIAFVSLPLLLLVITDWLSVGDPLYALVMFHSLFNLIGIVFFLPFIDVFTRALQSLVAEQPRRRVCTHIARVPAEVTEAAIEAARAELAGLIRLCMRLNRSVLGLDSGGDAGTGALPEDTAAYQLLKETAGELQAYTYEAQRASASNEDGRELTQINHAVRNVGYAAKYVKDIRHNLEEFADSGKLAIREAYGRFRDDLEQVMVRIGSLLEPGTRDPEMSRFLDIQRGWRDTYEHSIERIYRSIGSQLLVSTETASLLNANRALYLSVTALLEAVRVLHRFSEASIMQVSEAAPALEAQKGE